jgi:tetratricopeptide (TPR) repeat protein
VPTRPRSHQLEDLSIKRFSALLPHAWVIRRKDHDYGTDLEIEIFEDSGESTGLMFLVQLRATDDEKKSRSLVLSVDQVGYFRSLDLPTAIVRFCSVGETFFWQWHFNVTALADISEGQNSFTYKFDEDEAWSDETTASIRRTLDFRRLVEVYPPNRPISLVIGNVQLDRKRRFEIESCLAEIMRDIPDAFALSRPDYALLEFRLDVDENKIMIGADCCASMSADIDSFARKNIASNVLYCTVALLDHLRLINQARRVSMALLKLGYKHYSKFLAFQACHALSADLDKSVDLAVLNELHTEHDEYYPLFMTLMLRSPQDEEVRERATMKFFEVALVSASAVHPHTEAAVHYSIGNFHRAGMRHLEALRYFNRARRLRPAYLEADYFLRELGACLFGSNRYRLASALYQAALPISSSHRDHLHLGDALLFSGALREAEKQFTKAAESDDEFLKAEALLKLVVVEGMLRFFQTETAPSQRSEATSLMIAHDTPDFDLWHSIATKIDAFHELALFNLGVSYSKTDQFENALCNFLLCAFKMSGDDSVWANAMICAHRLQQPSLLVSILSTSISLNGRRSYERLRDLLIEQSAEESLIDALDEVFRNLVSQVEQAQSNDLTLRALRGNEFDIVLQVPG